MNRTHVLWVSAAAAVVLVAWASVLAARRHAPVVRSGVKDAAPNTKPDLPGFIAAHARDQDPKVQDIVNASRLRLGFAQADESWKTPSDHSKTFAAYEAARKTFLATAKSPKGTGEMNPDYGTLTDQAAYQAAVCLVAEGKTVQAKAEFVGFMKERPESPLCKACRDRLVRLNGGKPAPAYDALLQQDIAAQEKRIRFEYAVCGPKAIEAVLPLLGVQSRVPPLPRGGPPRELASVVGVGSIKRSPRPVPDVDEPPTSHASRRGLPLVGGKRDFPDYKAIAKLCGTTDKGTTIEGMRKGLKALGVMSYAFQLNAADFDHLKAPIIILRQTHYLVITKLDGKTGAVYDPMTKRTETLNLPKPDDDSFVANVITFKVPTLASN